MTISGNSRNSSTSADEEAQKILSKVGLESVPIDPSSMTVLKQMIVHRREDKDNQAAFARALRADGHLLEHNSFSSTDATPNPEPATSTSSAAGVNGSGSSSSSSNSSTNYRRSGTLKKPPPTSTAAAVAGSSSITSTKSSGSDASSAILEQLKLQTSLLLDLQQKVDTLNKKVEKLESNNTKASFPTVASPSLDPDRNSRPAEVNQDAFVRRMREIRNADDQHQHVGDRLANGGMNAPPLHQQQEQNAAGVAFVHALQNPLLWPVRFLVTWIRFEIRLVYEFYKELRAGMRPIDGGLVFQLLFVGMVFSSRINPSTNPERFVVLSAALAIGALYQLKFWDVFFRFFIKEKAPERLWRELNGLPPMAGNRNEINDGNNNVQGGADGNLPNGRPRMGRIGGQVADQAADGGGNNRAGIGRPRRNGNADHPWRNMFVMGGIYQRHQDGEDAAARNPVVGAVWDVVYLLGSFVFSIFPMWNPQAQNGPNHVQAPPDDNHRREGLEGVQQNPGHNEGGDRGIPQAQVPRDAMEPADTDDENDDED
mmetsp:Transcript_58574/g.143278  ORF Transcript_58574/g.143278 Transcript_58574/m.143278 type:complete len:541 (+) Transcript_58574:316-1938(+)